MKVLVSRETGRLYLLCWTDANIRKFQVEMEQGWMTLTYRKGLTVDEAIAIEYDVVGTL